ncbi:MAG: hypothetical protein J6W18_07745 [Bacteroidaceae bacterium]|nr:hypothetical protein [Bacteroidaceae bacterium]
MLTQIDNKPPNGPGFMKEPVNAKFIDGDMLNLNNWHKLNTDSYEHNTATAKTMISVILLR